MIVRADWSELCGMWGRDGTSRAGLLVMILHIGQLLARNLQPGGEIWGMAKLQMPWSPSQLHSSLVAGMVDIPGISPFKYSIGLSRAKRQASMQSLVRSCATVSAGITPEMERNARYVLQDIHGD